MFKIKWRQIMDSADKKDSIINEDKINNAENITNSPGDVENAKQHLSLIHI